MPFEEGLQRKTAYVRCDHPKGRALGGKRLLTEAPRLVDLQARAQRNEALLSRFVERLARFLKREDLSEGARAEAERLKDQIDDVPEF